VLKWLKERRRRTDPLAAWRETWAEAIEGRNGASAEALRTQLDQLTPNTPDVELELEMIEALDALHALDRQLKDGALPSVDTQHRVVGVEACHFTAPASVPADSTPSSGRVLFTRTRAIFVAGRTSAVAWHSVRAVIRTGRDVLLAKADGSSGAHYRFNTYADAVVAARLADTFKGTRGQP
jgi:hypothetical protein